MEMFTASATQICQNIAMKIWTHCFASGAEEVGGFLAFFPDYF